MPAYFDKAKKTWYVQFRYKDYTGVLKSTTKRGFERKKDALKYEKDFKELHSGSLNFPFHFLVDRYLEHVKGKVRENTYDTIKYSIELYITPFFKDMLLSQITTKNIIDWHDKVLVPASLADTYLRSINARLSSIFNYAKKYYGLSQNPVKLAGSLGSLTRKQEYDIWTRKELETFCEQIEKGYSSCRWHAIIYRVLFYTGMRPSEALALQESDINIEKKTISITKSYHRSKKGYYITDTKNKYSRRVVAIPTFLADELKDYLQKFKSLGYSGRIFPTSVGTLNCRLKRNAKKLGIKKIRLYDLRHSHASALISANLDINLIAKRMGHSSPATTLRVYSHFYGDKNKDITKFLDDKLESM